MKALQTTLFLIVSCLSMAQDSASVLFIGNSYTSVNNLPSLVQQLANSLGDEVYYDIRLSGGATFEVHAGNSATYDKINSESWDYVVLQAQSQEPSFPEAQVNSNTLPYAVQISDSVYENDICSEVLYYMTWGREDGDSQWGPISTFNGMNERLRLAYLRFADSTDASVSPVGSSWRYVRENDPSIDLYAADGSHPSFAGSYLAACTFYASIFRKTPVGSNYYGSLDQATAEFLQSAAELTVLGLDSLELFHLQPKSDLVQALFSNIVDDMTVHLTNESTRATDYIWDFGDGNTSTLESPSHTYALPGEYDIILTAENHCDVDSSELQVTVDTTLYINDLESLRISISNLGAGKYEVFTENSLIKFELYNSNGKKFKLEENDNTNKLKIDLSVNAKGVYYLYAKLKGQEKVIRLAFIE